MLKSRIYLQFVNILYKYPLNSYN